MTFKVGDQFFNTENGMTYRITSVSKHGSFILWESCHFSNPDLWVPIMNPARVEELEHALKFKVLLPDTGANRLLYDKR